jgi:methionyl-tRNA formyltransferase
MRLAFMGTPEFAVPTLDALLARGMRWWPSIRSRRGRRGGARGCGPPLSSSERRRRGSRCGAPLSLRDAAEQEAFAALGLDAAVVAAYGLILPVPILEAPRYGCLNVHGSILPRWRGAAPVQRAILAGDGKTGITIMQMERGLDTGPC